MKRNKKKALFNFGAAAVLTGAMVLGMAACNGNPTENYNGTGAEYIVSHTEGQKVSYTFEAENTDLSNKSGPSFSGMYVEKGMVVYASGVNASNNYVVCGMCENGASLNFIVVSDREVTDATLILRLGTENKMSLTFDADMFRVRVDPVGEEDLLPYTDSGAWGKWDEFFLEYYTEAKGNFAGYYVEEYECGNITVKASEYDPSGFTDYTVYTKLSLQKGVNCISLITNNNEVPAGTDNATFTATAPIVDCIKIETTAQLGLYAPQDNGYGTNNACTVTAK